MPDFEALIKQQQIKSSSSNERLRLVPTGKRNFKNQNINIPSYFIIGTFSFIGGCTLIIALYLTDLLEIYINKFNAIF